MASSPEAALSQLRRDAHDGTLARLCQEAGIALLVAFGSATAPDWPAPPRDLDLAVTLTGECDLFRALIVLTAHLGTERIDMMDLEGR